MMEPFTSTIQETKEGEIRGGQGAQKIFNSHIVHHIATSKMYNDTERQE